MLHRVAFQGIANSLAMPDDGKLVGGHGAHGRLQDARLGSRKQAGTCEKISDHLHALRGQAIITFVPFDL